jgi:transketolase
MQIDDLKIIRKNIIETSHSQKSGHIASSFSILEILYVLYKDVLTDNDQFVLSKGHAALGFYAVLNSLGKITDDELSSFASYDSNLGGHPDRNKIKDVFASAGSLGHGLPISVGVALSRKIQNQPGKIYCLVGDGECNEGSIWESALLASHLNLENLVCIVDNNRSQTRSVETNNIEEKFLSFGWETIVVDGHDTDLLKTAFKNIKNLRPVCVIANTVKGYGIESIQNDAFSWHHRAPTDKEFENMMSELK